MFFVDGGMILIGCFIVLCVEVEFVFVFGKWFIGLNCMIFDVYDVVDYVVFVFEIIDVCS